jgi:outer membrane protein TolC
MMNMTQKTIVEMVQALALGMLILLPQNSSAQRLLTLDSCRSMALRNNKQISVSKAKQEVAANLRKSARTKYLPHISALGGYVHTSKEMSILNDDQKSALGNLGTNAATDIQTSLTPYASILPPTLQAKLVSDLGTVQGVLNQGGQRIVDALRTDTRDMFAGTVMFTQPIFMGGAIVAMNKMADINEALAANSLEAKRQNTLFSIDRAYWQVVSLRHKEKLAQSYLELVKKLDSDVQKMVEEGVATRSDRLSVSVKVNEAEMALTKVTDGLVLSKMLLCQLCGLPVSEQVKLADEESESIAVVEVKAQPDMELAAQNRPELKMLQNTVDLTRQTTNLLRAGNLPKVLLTGGYAVSNPNTFNGFEKKFAGFWNIGVMVHVPIWNWGDVNYKVRAAKGATTIANLELDEAREMIELQVNQKAFLVNESNKKLAMAQSNIARAEENLRTANLGFKEGVISSTTVIEAQTAWLQAQSQKIDAEIDVKLSQVELQKSLGTLE